MSMLAEPRRKQRICPNPRGKFFMEDEANKGRTLLQKMGWKNGEGLGQLSQGMSVPIKPKVQNNSNGLGYDVKSDPWVEHNQRFGQILEQLNMETYKDADRDSPDPEEKRHELERKSKISRARIHYTKFVKNKDLSSISNQDWSCILGKNLNGNGKDNKNESNTKEKLDDAVIQTPEGPLNTINRGSMKDYFKGKLAEKLNKVPSNGTIYTTTEASTEEVSARKRKRKRERNVNDLNAEVVDSNEIQTETKENPDDAVGTSEELFNTINRGSMQDYFKKKLAEKSNKVPTSGTTDTTTEEVSVKKRKRKRERNNDDLTAEIESEEILTEVVTKSKKKKRRSIKQVGDTEEVLSGTEKKTKKPKKSKQLQENLENEVADEIKNSKKKRKQELAMESLQEAKSLEEDTIELIELSKAEKKQKKKARKELQNH